MEVLTLYVLPALVVQTRMAQGGVPDLSSRYDRTRVRKHMLRHVPDCGVLVVVWYESCVKVSAHWVKKCQ